MTPREAAGNVVGELESDHDALMQAWQDASNAGDFALARKLNRDADRAADRLIDARQRLVTAIDNGADLSRLVGQMSKIVAEVQAEKARSQTEAERWTAISKFLDAVGDLVKLAKGS